MKKGIGIIPVLAIPLHLGCTFDIVIYSVFCSMRSIMVVTQLTFPPGGANSTDTSAAQQLVSSVAEIAAVKPTTELQSTTSKVKPSL